MPVPVEIVSTPACPRASSVRLRLEELARDAGIEVRVTETVLSDLDAARARRFRGSPTVFVDGCDVEPALDEAPGDFGLG